MDEIEKAYQDEEENIDLENEHAELANTSHGLRAILEAISDRLHMGERFPKKPSFIKYSILLWLAVMVDLVDFMALDLVGGLYLLAATFSVCVTIVLFLISWLTNTKFTDARKYNKSIVGFIQEVRGNIAHASRMAIRSARVMKFVGKRVPAARAITSRASRGIMRGLVKVRRAARGNPITKILVTAGLNIIPLLSFIPWMSVGIILSYLDERKTFRNTKEYVAELDEERAGASEVLESIDSTLTTIESVIMEKAA